MNVTDILIPQKGAVLAPDTHFHWNLGSETTYAANTSFYLNKNPIDDKKNSWVFSGSTGSLEKENWFSFFMYVPYMSEDPFEYTYKLGDGKGLYFSHAHSIPAPPGSSGVRVVEADDAELAIRLDPLKGTVHGDFNAEFKTYRLKPDGTFDMTRQDQ